ncbi:MAG: DUF1499 domain-containing protein [Rhizobiaceae bacterium]
MKLTPALPVSYERRQSGAARWSRRIASFSAVLLVTAALAHRFDLVQTEPFFWVLGVVALLAVFALILAATGYSQLWTNGDKGGRNSTWGVVTALVVLLPFIISAYRIAVFPFLSDISTDLADPPALTRAAALRTGGMNTVEPISPQQGEIQARNYPGVTGRRYNMPAERVREALDAALANHAWTPLGPTRPLADEAGPETTVELTAYSFWLALPADVAIRVIDEGDTTYVDMRSASRYARHDFGDNATRIEAFLAELDTEVATRFAAVPTATDQ